MGVQVYECSFTSALFSSSSYYGRRPHRTSNLPYTNTAGYGGLGEIQKHFSEQFGVMVLTQLKPAEGVTNL